MLGENLSLDRDCSVCCDETRSFSANISAPQTKEEYTGTVIGIGGQLGRYRPFRLP